MYVISEGEIKNSEISVWYVRVGGGGGGGGTLMVEPENNRYGQNIHQLT